VGELECETAPRSPEMETAHLDPEVQNASQAFLQAPVRGMVKVLAISLYNYLRPADQRPIVLDAGIDNAMHPMAYQMIAATNAIYRMDPVPRGYARGAVIEQIAEALLRERKPHLLTEQCIGPLEGNHWTNGKSDSIDFYMEDAPQEFWDAKSDSYKIESRHINQFDQLLGLADPGAMAGFITLDDTATVVDRLDGMRGFTRPIHAYTFENFETMARDRPLTRVDSWAA
jgi:hypothetical protein